VIPFWAKHRKIRPRPTRLRRTNRLRDYLANNGYATYRSQHQESILESLFDSKSRLVVVLTEAEFVPVTTCEQTWPRDFRLSELFRVMRGENDRRVTPTWVQPFVRTSDHARFTQVNNDHQRPFEDHGVDILWLSPTEFISIYPFQSADGDLGQYSVTIWLRSKLSLRLYPQTIPWIAERILSPGPSPELPLRFLGKILMPFLNEVLEIKFEATLSGPWPANASVLLIVPSREQELSNNMRVSIWGARHDLVRSFATFPCHPKVCLSFF
jgi:hypothetical protein